MGERGSSPSSSTDSSSHPALSTASSFSRPARDLSTDLRLGLSISSSSSIARSTLEDKRSHHRHPTTFFVKVNMDGIPIGRKLDLFTLNSYEALTKTLSKMFRTSILRPDLAQVPSKNSHVLIYEDKEGDWMMVGDVPWEMFLATVKRVKITRADNC
ncbi:auxin-responsive protein IAA4-like isoform X2 [Dioscorea cayenensis subsp. rotundata]|uniref:Auxin-responsive protein n=1 Tax=Dioscorea cayennensis subsp. rotundata TaxID=55577 RepID=A0AB40BQG6_DIOCR|nr:auxin-responsive protein IAA4-like isoform X2 [Dioscorea cayenensis subsp. rotundata]